MRPRVRYVANPQFSQLNQWVSKVWHGNHNVIGYCAD